MTREKVKELAIQAIRLYTLLVALITVMMFFLGNLLDRDRVFGYDAFLSPLLYALIGTVAAMVTRSGRELSVRNLILRKAASLLIIEGAIVFLALNAETIPTEKSWVLPGLALGVLVIFVLAHLILYFADRKEAERLSADLARYQERILDHKV